MRYLYYIQIISAEEKQADQGSEPTAKTLLEEKASEVLGQKSSEDKFQGDKLNEEKPVLEKNLEEASVTKSKKSRFVVKTVPKEDGKEKVEPNNVNNISEIQSDTSKLNTTIPSISISNSIGTNSNTLPTITSASSLQSLISSPSATSENRIPTSKITLDQPMNNPTLIINYEQIKHVLELNSQVRYIFIYIC